MSIIRVKKDSRYFTTSNEPFNDPRLHWETRGMMGYLLSKPNNWQIRLADLVKQGPAGEYKIKKMLKEAQQCGYINRHRVVHESGKFSWYTDVYESPSLNPNPQTSGRFSTTGTSGRLSTSGKPPDVLSTDETNTETTTRADIFGVYEKEIGVLTPMIADALKDAEQTYDADWIRDAIAIAVKRNVRNWKFAEAILKRWKEQGFKDDGVKPQKQKRKGKTQDGESALDRYAKEQGYSDGE